MLFGVVLLSVAVWKERDPSGLAVLSLLNLLGT